MTDWNREIKDWTDERLKNEIAICQLELEKVSENDPNSEWHGACFAAFIMMNSEAQKRPSLRGRVH